MRKTYKDIPGWLPAVDYSMFDAILRGQSGSMPGDLVEIGVYLGKSAVVVGAHLRPDERFVVVDTFGDPALLGLADPTVAKSKGRNYFKSLDRAEFEANYLSVHDELPVVFQARSADIVDHAAPGSVRFIHVDGSHQYEDVAVDCRSAKELLRPDGVAVFDDWRKESCPGVAAAIWESVLNDGLIPVALTEQKFYGVYGDPKALAKSVRGLVAGDSPWGLTRRELMGRQVLHVHRRVHPRTAPQGEGTAGRRTVRQFVAAELAPPALTRWVRTRRGLPATPVDH